MNVAFGELVEFAVGGGWGEDQPSDGMVPVRVIRGADFPAAESRDLASAPLRFEPSKKAASRTLREGDIVLEVSGGTTDRPTGRSILASPQLLSSVDDDVIPASFCRLVRIDRTKASPAFVYYALQDLYNRGGTWEFQNQSTGIANFQFELFRERWRLDIPSLAQQQAIAEVLGALDDKIAANTALAATADLYASTVLLGSLGAGRVRLASVAHITMGSSPKGDTLNELGQGVPFYQGVRDFGFRSPTRRVFTTAPVRSANAGDILVSVRAPVGDVNVADEPVCIGRGIAAVRSTTGAQATLLHQLKAERNAWEPFEAEGTVFGSINRDQLHGIQLHAVAPERVEFVEEELAAIESSIAATLAENRTLAATRDALLPQLMSGKLRVRDAEDLIVQASV